MEKEVKRFHEIKVSVLTVSDRGHRGEREDQSGAVILEVVDSNGWELLHYSVLPDERETIKNELMRLADEVGSDIIFTTGGTGLAPRDITPDATLEVISREVPGMAEEMRRESRKKTPHAMLSRAVCGVRGKTLIINFPGSPQAVRECMDVILTVLPHAVELLKGEVSDCGR